MQRLFVFIISIILCSTATGQYDYFEINWAQPNGPNGEGLRSVARAKDSHWPADVDQQLTTWSELLILHHLVANRVDVTFTSSEITYLESVMMNDPCGNGAYAMSLLYTFAGCAMHEATACPELRRAELQSSTSEQEVTSKVYPNPVALGSATIQTQFAVNEITSITILDYMGRNVIEMQLPANMQELPFNAELLAAGVYMIHIRNSVTDEYFNFVKQ